MVISSGSALFKVLFAAIATLGFVCLLLVATLQTEATKSTTTVQTTASFKHEADIGREKLIYDPELDFNYMMSKRKVPNGPDPIHNRKAGNSKRPSGRV
ncbi:CLAVATA3/ESR (CLE)-related protein 25 [Hevea brasiliensis]|uniref:CLAVATA3/ESR (CLE)-related protein 25 n=1 Tax=Hevea brasiliensis TaxID=3981 RepID=UPI0025E87C87|nr:CLAVATA3/ESR (CLE)-related protein 25 [Hevea brasiliensis]